MYILRKRITSFSSLAFGSGSHFVSDSYYPPDNVVSYFRNKISRLFWPDPSLGQINPPLGSKRGSLSHTRVKRGFHIQRNLFISLLFSNITSNLPAAAHTHLMITNYCGPKKCTEKQTNWTIILYILLYLTGNVIFFIIYLL